MDYLVKEVTVFFRGREGRIVLTGDIDAWEILQHLLVEAFPDVVMFDYNVVDGKSGMRVGSVEELQYIVQDQDCPVLKLVLNLGYNLRVGSYNVANFTDHENWNTRVHRVVGEIKKSACDVVGLQEIRHDTGQLGVMGVLKGIFVRRRQLDNMTEPHMMLDLIDQLPEFPYYLWQPVMQYNRNRVEGLGVLSRLPIMNSEFHPLPRAVGDRNQRGVLQVTLDHEYGPVDIFITHITYDVRSQEDQIAEVLRFASAKQSLRIPQVLLGDFNVTQAYEKPCLMIEKGGKGITAWVDCWRETKGRFAAKHDHGYTFRPWKRRTRYDRIYVRGPFLKPLQFTVEGAVSRQDQAASDHCFVYSDFKYSGRG